MAETVYKYEVSVGERFVVRWGFISEYGTERFEVRLWGLRKDGRWGPTKTRIMMTKEQGMEFLGLCEELYEEKFEAFYGRPKTQEVSDV